MPLLRKARKKIDRLFYVSQINCKLGGELWACPAPFKDPVMVVGIDVFHDPTRKGASIAGFVSSLNTSFTRWHSTSVYQVRPSTSSPHRGQISILTAAVSTIVFLTYPFVECPPRAGGRFEDCPGYRADQVSPRQPRLPGQHRHLQGRRWRLPTRNHSETRSQKQYSYIIYFSLKKLFLLGHPA